MVDDLGQDALDTLSRFSQDVDGIFGCLFGPGWAANRHVVVLCLVFGGESLTTRQISDGSGMSRRSLTRLMTSLRSGGLIELGRAPEDARAMAVTLTDAGAERRRALAEALDSCFARYADRAEGVVVGLGGPSRH